MSSNLTGVTNLDSIFMENPDLRSAVYEYLSDNLSVNVSTETEYDYYDNYDVIRVTISLLNPSTGKYEVISECSDSIHRGS